MLKFGKSILGWILLSLALTSSASSPSFPRLQRAPRDIPFDISDSTIGSGSDTLHTKVLSNLKTGEKVKIIWDAGGRVESLFLLDSQRKLRDVLLGHNGSAPAIRENAYWKGCLLAPFANRIANATYTFMNTTYHLPINEPSRQDALHGFLCNKTTSIVSQRVGVDFAELVLSYLFDGTDPGYPFLLNTSITYRLTIDSGFDLFVTATNVAEDNQNGVPLPFTFGWHPYFRAVDTSKVVIRFDKCGWNRVLMGPGAPRNGSLIPTGQTQIETGFDGGTPIGGLAENPTYYDNEWKATRRVLGFVETEIRDPVAGYSSFLWQDSSFPLTQLFTGSMSLWGESAIAFEPMSGMADAFNNHDHLSILSAREQWSGSFGVYLQ